MERREIRVLGTVHGVGFRPFVYGLASRLELGGFVRNRVSEVNIEIEGETEPLDEFLSLLVTKAPPLARIEEISWDRTLPLGDRTFHIQQSDDQAEGPIAIGPDSAICDDCLAELFDPANRRHGYPFITCTNCGPRLTIVTGAPYDRKRSTMAGFPMCEKCRAEYEAPADRRFHAQAIACQNCGPRLTLLDAMGNKIESSDPLVEIAAALASGKICAIKGIGGYHLACDARNSSAVEELRRRKHRDEKPFAVMVADLDAARELCELSALEEELLISRQRPIVLLKKRGQIALADSVAPGNPALGIMLPYTPIHYLLFRKLHLRALVMTSGNKSDEPIAFEEADAIVRLRGIADFYLIHDRPIHVRCDDSVTRVIGNIESPIRRSRGYAPESLRLPICCNAPILALGGQMKATFALGGDNRVVLSHHLGDLDHYQNLSAFEKDISLYEQLFSFHPEILAHDMHPDYASTRYALHRAAEANIPTIAVQHHHAHLASCMAENQLSENVIGVIFDGTGYGTDGKIWGGEFLTGNYHGFHRAAHLRYISMPGAAQAIHEPWRMAAAYLLDAQTECSDFDRRFCSSALLTIRAMLDRLFNSPLTSSAGRLFDAVASLAGIRDRVSFEGQAAMQLEWLASINQDDAVYSFEIAQAGDQPLIVDSRPMIRSIAQDVSSGISAGRIARRFHNSLVEMISDVCCRLRSISGIEAIVLSGGVFMNALLNEESHRRLMSDGFRVYRQQRVPPNDGGLSLGQVAVAASQFNSAA